VGDHGKRHQLHDAGEAGGVHRGEAALRGSDEADDIRDVEAELADTLLDVRLVLNIPVEWAAATKERIAREGLTGSVRWRTCCVSAYTIVLEPAAERVLRSLDTEVLVARFRPVPLASPQPRFGSAVRASRRTGPTTAKSSGTPLTLATVASRCCSSTGPTNSTCTSTTWVLPRPR
jgi:hypothetical protein